MATPHPSPADREAALLLAAFRAHAALSPAQVEYLRQRGFLALVDSADSSEYDDPYDYDFQADRDDELHDAGDRLTGRSPGRGGCGDAPQEWSLDRLGEYLGALLEGHRDRLLILTTLAPAAAAFDDVLSELRGLDADELAARLDQGLAAGWLSFHDLWEVTTLDAFRRPLPASGPAYRAYRATLQAADRDQLPGKYVWVLRSEEVACVQRLVRVQRNLLAAAGRLWADDPGLVSRRLRRDPHLLGLLAHVLLFNSQPAAARAWASSQERFASLPPHEHADLYRRAWTLAVQMDADAILPFLIDWFTPPVPPIEGPRLLVPTGWCEAGYRARGTWR